VAELADAPDLGSGGETHGGSSPPFRTKHLDGLRKLPRFVCAQFCAHLVVLRFFQLLRNLSNELGECPLDRVRLRMDVPLSDGDGTVPRNPRQRESIAARLSQCGQRRVPENVGLEVRQLAGVVLFGCGVCVRNRLSVLILGRVFVQMTFSRR